jgi:hypothetical protein
MCRITLKFGNRQFYIPPFILNSKFFLCGQLRKPFVRVCSPVRTNVIYAIVRTEIKYLPHRKYTVLQLACILHGIFSNVAYYCKREHKLYVFENNYTKTYPYLGKSMFFGKDSRCAVCCVVYRELQSKTTNHLL